MVFAIVVLCAAAAVLMFVFNADSQAQASTVPQNEQAPTVAEFAQERGASLSATAAEALADEAVTFDEMEHAIALQASCVESAGIGVIVTPGDGQRLTSLGYEIHDDDGVPDAETLAEGHAIIDQCAAQYTADLTTAWLLQWTPPSPSASEQAKQILDTCIAAGGTGKPLPSEWKVTSNRPIASEGEPGTPLSDEQIRGFQLYTQCAQDAEAKTGVYPPYD